MQQHSVSTAIPSLWLLPTGGIQHLHAVLHTNGIQRERTQRPMCYFSNESVFANIPPEEAIYLKVTYTSGQCVISHCKQNVNWSPLQDAITGGQEVVLNVSGRTFRGWPFEVYRNQKQMQQSKVGYLWSIMQRQSIILHNFIYDASLSWFT